MALNPQTQAIAVSNSLISMATQLMAIYNQISSIDAQWTDQGVANTLNAMGTVALGTDGTTGSPDATPQTGHPLDPTKYPSLQRSLSATQIASLKTILDNIVTYVNGSAVSATAGARGILNGAIGG